MTVSYFQDLKQSSSSISSLMFTTEPLEFWSHGGFPHLYEDFQVLSCVKGLLYFYSLPISLSLPSSFPLLFPSSPLHFFFTPFPSIPSLSILLQSICIFTLPKPWFISDNLCNSFLFILIHPVLLYDFGFGWQSLVLQRASQLSQR